MKPDTPVLLFIPVPLPFLIVSRATVENRVVNFITTVLHLVIPDRLQSKNSLYIVLHSFILVKLSIIYKHQENIALCKNNHCLSCSPTPHTTTPCHGLLALRLFARHIRRYILNNRNYMSSSPTVCRLPTHQQRAEDVGCHFCKHPHYIPFHFPSLRTALSKHRTVLNHSVVLDHLAGRLKNSTTTTAPSLISSPPLSTISSLSLEPLVGSRVSYGMYCKTPVMLSLLAHKSLMPTWSASVPSGMELDLADGTSRVSYSYFPFFLCSKYGLCEAAHGSLFWMS